MSENKRNVTQKIAAANRRNARQSTGPKTDEGKSQAAMNSFQHGGYAQPTAEMRKVMLIIGEDPERIESLERDLAQSWQPSNAMQALLVADMANLYAEKYTMHEAIRLWRLGEREHDDSILGGITDKDFIETDAPIDEAELEKVGYRGVPACRRALNASKELLARLSNIVMTSEWNAEWPQILRSLYGSRPEGIGKSIVEFFGLLTAKQFNFITGEQKEVIRRMLDLLIEKDTNRLEREKDSYERKKMEKLAEDTGTEWLPGTNPSSSHEELKLA